MDIHSEMSMQTMCIVLHFWGTTRPFEAVWRFAPSVESLFVSSTYKAE